MTETTLTCANHPTTETRLRCNRCGKPICSKCAKRTPVGYRCKECVKEQQQVFETATTIDYPIAFFVAGLSTLFSVWALSFIGFFGLLVSPAIGVGVAEIIRRGVRNHRGQHLPTAAVAGALLGALPIVARGLGQVFAGNALGFNSLGLIWPTVYAFLIISTLYWRLRGIRV